ncbi:hypothetical protein [Lentilitoribacter sp. Alg239-R112]|uniref:hypothetical protein n=1 Tax=Lentilitoribacter sp. Alg239-R112 TaxID=2305987 RepID=UPI0013A695E8|nr:hypothetical protein [Lentilitoribacter sp. Alg239-R112]
MGTYNAAKSDAHLELIMAEETRFIVQTYGWKAASGGTPAQLVITETKEVPSEADAVRRAERIHDKSTDHVGVDAYRVTVDDEAGEYDDPVFFARLGDVPDFGD